MSIEKFDLVVIGGGPAGHKASIQAAKVGKRVLLVDRQKAVGGECVHRGTIPSKTLRETALGMRNVGRLAPDLVGSTLAGDMKVTSLMRSLDSVRDAHAEFMGEQLNRNGIVRWRGRAQFVSEHELTVRGPDRSERRVWADHVLIATGSRPRCPDNIPVDHENILDSDSILSLIYLPQSMTVIGSGVVACEFATIFAALGVQVTIIDRFERPLGFMDAELVDRFLSSFVQMGGTFLPNRKIESVTWDGFSKVEARLDTGEMISAEKMFVAAGRIACVKGLGLEHTNVELSERGTIVVDEFCQTASPHIYAAGDAIGPPALAAASMEQGRRAVLHAFDLPVPPSSSCLPIGIYTIPEMASVGMTEEQAIAEHGDVLTGQSAFGELARGQICGDTEGLLKLVSDPTGKKLLGAHIVGHGATELIHVAQMAIMSGANIDTFVDSIFNFPTMAEGYRVAAIKIVQARRMSLRKAG
ncbi:MAG: NAD(P) transhydrogenase [Planctomycetota bacterium]|jgi:NAD(P) transhydrogenase